MSFGEQKRWRVSAIGYAVALILLTPVAARATLPVCGGTPPPPPPPMGQNAITSASPSPYASANVGQDVTLTGTAESDASGVSVQLNGGTPLTTSLSGGSSQQSWSLTVPAATFDALADGTITATATVQLAGGSSVSAGSLSITKDTVAPGTVSQLTATGGAGQVALSWVNPTDADFAAVRLLMSPTTFASSPTVSGDQTLVFEGNSTMASAMNLTAGATYYFTIFARDGVGNWSSAATVTGTPSAAPPPMPVSFSDSFAGCPYTTNLGPNWTITGTWYCRSDKARGESAQTTARANTTTIGDVQVTVRVQLTSSSSSGGLVARASNGNYYAARMLGTGKIQIIRVNGSTTTVLGEVSKSLALEPTSYRLTFKVTGTSTVQLDVWLNSTAVLSAQDSSAQALTSGQVGMYNGAQVRTAFDSFSAQSL